MTRQLPRRRRRSSTGLALLPAPPPEVSSIYFLPACLLLPRLQQILHASHLLWLTAPHPPGPRAIVGSANLLRWHPNASL